MAYRSRRTFSTLFAVLVAPLAASDGDLDAAFWDDGKVFFSGTGTYSVNAVIAAPDDRVVVAGTYDPLVGNRQWFWKAVGTDSATTSAFCFYSPPEGATGGHAEAAAFDDQGRLYLGGAGHHGTDQLAVARFTYPDCTPDIVFHANGYWTTDIPGGIESVTAMAISSVTGTIALGGYQNLPTGTDWLVAKIGLGGGFIISFSDDGWLTEDVSGSSTDDGWISGIALANGGKVIVAGSSHQAADDIDWHVLQYTSAGLLDPTFAGDGRQTVAFNLVGAGAGNDTLFAMARDTRNGKILLAGSAETPDGRALALARLQPTGALDSRFSGDGRVTLSFGDAETRLEAVAVDDLDRVVVGGFLDYPASDSDFIVLRYDANGVLDPTFGFSGLSLVAFNAGPDVHDDDYGRAMTIQAGRVVVAGEVEATAASESRVGLARLAGALLFADGFEGGNDNHWSASGP